MRIDKTVQYHAIQRPDNIGLIQDGVEITYREIDSRAIKIANGLLAMGIEKNHRIVLVGETSIDQVLLILAASKIGAVSVTLNYRLAVPELNYIISDSSAKLVAVLDGQFISAIEQATASIDSLNFFAP